MLLIQTFETEDDIFLISWTYDFFKKMADEFSHEFRELKRKQFLEEKRRQRLRENNQELREIAKHLRTAYSTKTLKDQQQQLETKKQEELKRKQQETLEIEEQLKRHKELLKQEQQQEQEKKEKTRNILKDQMVESLKRRQETIEEMTRDRDHLDGLLKNLKLEQANQQKEEEEARKEALKQEIEDFMRQQENHKRKILQLDEEERMRAEEIQRQRDEDMKRIKDLQRLDRAKQEALSEKIGLDVYKKELEKRRREDVMLELLQEERKAKEDYRFRENLERQVRGREQVRFELERFIEQRKLENEQQKRNKLSTERAEMERLILENEKKSAIEIQRLREKEQSYNSSIQQMLQERRHVRALGLASHLGEFEFLRSEERKMQQEIEEERRRLLQNHPSEVLRYLPSGVLCDSDREFLALPPGNKEP